MKQTLPALLLLLAAAIPVAAQDYALGPDSQPNPNVPKGVVTKYQLAPGKFYPGTPHTYSVYVPAKYDASKPAPFMIFLDGSGSLGNGQRVPVVFDNLIARGDLPPLIGIFIDPGVLPTTPENSATAQNRYERIFEYDNISDRFSSFLEAELIPEVGKKYNLSKNPDDHAISGVSTGAVGAFVAAWHRPDMFHRVLSFIGTFVSLKGADTLPAAIRRTEPKPIRVYLQAGKNDHTSADQPFGVFYGGSWPMNNQVMYDALRFSGYDVKFNLGEEGHNMKHGAAIMPEALTWLWRDYPKPVVAREPAALSKQDSGWEPRGNVFTVISADKQWEQVGGTYGAVSSPAGDKDGNVYFADAKANRVYKADPSGKVATFRDNAAGVRAVRVGPDGRIYAAKAAGIVSWGLGGDEKNVAAGVSASDLAITAKGGVYFTDPARKTVGYIDPAGKLKTV